MIAEALIRWFVAEPEAVSAPATRQRYGTLEGGASIVVNLVVFVVKLVPGLLIGSISLVADAFHSLGDVLSSAVVIWGFRVAAKPPDREHPFGHGRFESIASLLVAVLLLLTAWEFGKASVARLLDPHQVHASPVLLAILTLTLVLKEWLSRFSLRLGRAIDSPALIGDFWHHRSDVIATAVVIAALVAARFGWWWVDGAGGVVVSLFIAWASLTMLRESVNPLIGEAPSPSVLQAVREEACAVAEVEEVHDVIVHYYGELLVTSLHIEVPAEISLVRAHEVAEEVEDRVNQRLAGWTVVHVDPVDRQHPLYAKVWRALKEAADGLPEVQDFHDLRIVGSQDHAFVIFDLQASDGKEAQAAATLRAALLERFPCVDKVVVNLRPRYVY